MASLTVNRPALKKTIYTCFFLLASVLCAQAQGTDAKITGTIVDSANSKPLSFATVSLQNAATHITIKSTVTTDKGGFQLAVSFQPGVSYELVISHVGYQSKPVGIQSTTQDLGTITLANTSGQLQSVTVEATKPLVKQEVDRLVYDVQSDPQTKGQTAMDMLRRVPLITVDGDDNIQLQGSGSYRIFINGKPSAMVTSNPKDVLRGMPANTIQKIEVITTPPAKYDAEGLAGIINIITIKKTADGYNGTVSLRQSFPFGPGLNATATIKQKTFGLSYFGGASLRPLVNMHQTNDRKTYGPTPDILFQRAVNMNKGNFAYSGVELSNEFDSLHLVTASVNYALGTMNQDYDRTSSYYTEAGPVLQSYHLFSDGGNKFINLDLGINYQLGFANRKEQLLTTSYRYSYSLNGQHSNIVADNRFQYNQPDNNQQNDAGYKEHTFQLDYVHPVKKLTIEAGAKAILRDNYSTSQGFVSTSTGYVKDPSRTNVFDYRQDVYSFYNSYKLQLNKWIFQGGVRAEYTKVNADFASTATKLDMDYLNFVPTLSILKNLKNNNTLSFGITNRLFRPGIYQLNPFVDKTNPQIINTGNPNLRPVISHLFELSWNKIGKGSLNTRLSYMYINNSIESVTQVIADTLSLTSFDNVGQSKIARINFNGSYPLTPKLSVNFNTGIFYVWITGTYNGRFYSNQGPRTNTFVNSSYKMNSTWQFGLSGGYNRRYINLQGSSNDYWYTTISANCTLKNFTISGSVNNPFYRTYAFTQYSDTPDFYQALTNNLLYRSFNLNISYKFGKLNSALKKNKRGINNDDAAPTSN